MKNILASTLEKAVNTYLSTDPDSAKRLAKLSGKSIAIDLLPFHFHINCHFNHDGVSVSLQKEETPLTRISGTPLQLLGVLAAKDNRHQFFADDLTIEGDAEFADAVINLFDNVHIDWENHASQFIGDVPAYQFGKVINRVQSWLGKTQTNFTEDINDYLHEEAAWFPRREALQDFFNEIDTLRMDTDRLESRLNQLNSSLDHEEQP